MEMEVEKQSFLTINIEYKNAIPLLEFKESLEGWYNQYNKHLSQSNISKDEETLLIKEIKQGSIIIQLISSVMPLLNDYSTIISFYTSMKFLITWLSTKMGKKPEYDTEELENMKKIISPVNSVDKSLNISINGDDNTVIIIDKVVAQKINQNANEELLKLSNTDKIELLPDLSSRENVLLRFKQIESAEKNNKNTKGIISEIDNKSHPVLFGDGLKHPIIHGTDNPLIKNYLLNVKIEREDNEIKSYTIINVIDSYEDEDGESAENALFKDN